MFQSLINNKNRSISFIAGIFILVNLILTTNSNAAEYLNNVNLKGIEPQHIKTTLTMPQLRQSALAGDSRAQFIYGRGLLIGKNIEQNSKLGLQWIEKSAQQGFTVAQYQLALLLEYGQGTKADHQTAAKWHLKAAEQGNIGAQHSIAMMYLDGKGIEKDLVNAYTWMSLAYENGYQEIKVVRDHIQTKLSDNQQLQAQIRIHAYRNGTHLSEQLAFARK